MTTEEILWLAIKDIEDGKAFTINEDPINGYLHGNNKKLTKQNVSYQSAKYTLNGKPISRPTIDSYKEISEYLTKEKKNLNISDIIKERDELLALVSELNNQVKKIANQNFILNENIKFLKSSKNQKINKE